MVIQTRVVSVFVDASEGVVHRNEGLLAISDARQEQAIVKLCLHGLCIDSRLDQRSGRLDFGAAKESLHSAYRQCIHFDVPLREQPFRYVALILVALTPFPQISGTSARFLREPQPSYLFFELSSRSRNVPHGLSPVRVSAFAMRSS